MREKEVKDDIKILVLSNWKDKVAIARDGEEGIDKVKSSVRGFVKANKC